MAGEAYQVDYIINLQDNASAGITKFSSAASRLTKAENDLKKFETTFNQVVAKFDKPLKMSINTQNAHKSLDKVLNKIKKIQTEALKINVGTASNNVRNQRVANQVQAPVVTPARAPRQQGPRPLRASRAGQPLIPRNLEYQVLGPTRLGNVAMLDMFKGMGLMYGISAIGSGVRDILSQSTEYENIMQTAKNILKTNYKGGNFDANFVDLERIAREVGVETKFTAPEVADAVKFLAMAGLDINAIKKSIRPIADIALIGDTELGQTADVMTNIMTAYGIRPDDMRKTADVMTRTFTMSNTTLMELAESFKMAGSMLHLANVPFETAAAAFGVLGDAGIKATMAGTTMRTIMNNLRNPTKNQQKYWDMLGIRRFDEYGNLREINEIFADLNKLNGNDERSRTAKAKYDELQKKYAPQLEGLQEGSVEYNKVIAEYDKESEAIRRQFGGVDVFRLFRLTAASGAGVLMNSVEKWNQIIQENFLSEGLSQKLADEKKNQIAGLWAQMKSAFQEGGLKVFEENDGRIRGYLSRGISWLKSTEFTDLLRSVFDLVADLGKTLLDFTKIILNLYNKFGPLIKRFLQFQLYAKGLQTILVGVKGLGNTFLYYASMLLGSGRMRALPVVRGMAAGAPMAGVMGAANMSGWFSSALYNNPFYRRMGKGYSTLLETGSPWQAAHADKRYQTGANANVAANMALYKNYANRNRRIQAMNQYAGLGMMAGGVIGGVIGNNFNENNGAMWGSIIGSGIGSMLPMLFSAGPWGVFAGAAIAAVTGVTSYIVKFKRELAEADKQLAAFKDNERRLGLHNIDVSDAESVFRANIRLSTDALISENEAMRLKLKLMQQIADFGTEEHESAEHGVQLDQTPFGQSFKEKLGYYQTKVKENWSLGQHLDSWLPWLDSPVTWKQAATDMANSNENPKYLEGSDYIRKTLLGITNKEEWDRFKEWYVKEGPGYTPSELINQGVSLTDKQVENLTDTEFYRLQPFAGATNKRLENELNYEGYQEFVNLIDQIRSFNPGNLDHYITAQKAMRFLNSNPLASELLDQGKYGWFGSQDWIENMKALRKQGYLTFTDENGEDQTINFRTAGMFNNVMQSVYDSFSNVYGQLNPEIQKYFSYWFDKNYWEQIGEGLDLSKFNTPIPYVPLLAPDENGEGTKYTIPNYGIDEWTVRRSPYAYGFVPNDMSGAMNAFQQFSVPEATVVTTTEAETANNNANNGNVTTVTAQGFPFYRPDWMPENTLPPLNNEAFRPVERQQVAMVARPVVININTDRFMDVSNIDIDNQQDTETLRQTMKDVFADIVSEIAADTGGQFNLGVA